MSRFVFQPFQSRHSGTIGELMQAGARARADALRKVGAIEAARAQQQGAIGAQAAQTIGGIVSGGVQQYLQAQQDAPRREAEALQVQALKDEASQRTAALQGQKVIDTLLKGALTTDPETGATTYDRSKLQQGITEAGVGHLWGQVAPLLDKSDASVKEIREAQHAALVDVARIVDATGNDATVFAGELSRGVKNGIFSEAEAAPYLEAVKRNPGAVAKITGSLLGQKQTLEKVSPGESLVDPRNPQAGAVYTAPPKAPEPSAAYREWQDYQREGGKLDFNAYQNMDANRKRPVTHIGAGGPEPAVAPDPASANILSQTGLSINAFRYLTGQANQLPRDAATRSRAASEAGAWSRAHNVDISTLPAQYKAQNDVLAANITRLNSTKIMEQELLGTIQNLSGVVTDQGLGRVKFANIARVWAGQEVNDDLAQQYAMHLSQLRNELMAYYGATQGRTGNNLTLDDKREAEGVIKNGIAKGSLAGLKTAVENSTSKMGAVMEGSVDRAQRAIWGLFGVGQNYRGGTGTATVAPTHKFNPATGKVEKY